jgi:cytochrome c oxidase subunit 2
MVLAAAVGLWAAAASGQGGLNRAAEGERVFKEQGCYGCHMVGKSGTPIGPDLSHIGGKYSEKYLERWLNEPQQQKPTAHMPKIELTEAEMRALAGYLASLR